MGNQIVYNGHVYEHQQIKSGSCYLARSLLSDVLEIDILSFELESTDSALTQFTRNAPLTYLYNSVPMGIFYVQKVTRTSKTVYHFEATNIIGLLDERKHYGGLYNGETVKAVVDEICSGLPHVVKTNLQDTALYGWLPIATCRANLAQVLFALGAVAKTDFNGVLHIEGLWSEVSSEIDDNKVFIGGSVDRKTPATRVTVAEHAYIKGGTRETLFEGLTAEGDIITFDEPCYSLTATGFTIKSSGANYAILSSGNGKLTGVKYIHSTRDIVKQSGGRSGDSSNDISVKDATLVSLANSNAVSERIMRYYSWPERIQNDVVYNREIPGDVVQTVHPLTDSAVKACLESVNIKMSQKLRAQETGLVGFTPLEAGAAEYYDEYETITSNRTWTVPKGVTSIRIVLIGAGNGGSKGSNGDNGAKDGTVMETNNSRVKAFSSGGKGGSPGSPGDGGRIFQALVQVTPGQRFYVSIGIGGKGGDSNKLGGYEGGHTKFGTYSSENGASNSRGYTHFFTGETYALPGISNGVRGGDGTGGKPNEDSTDIISQTITGPDGTRWQPGNTVRDYVSESKSGQGRIILWNGQGGGAAVGANGKDGRNSYKDAPKGDGLSSLSGGGSGDGADAAPRTDIPDMPGRGGYPGHGGGGGGGQTSHSLNTIGSVYIHSASIPSIGYGGKGGNGGKGANGIVIIYYQKSEEKGLGKLIGREGKEIFDKYGRRIVV